MGVSFRGHRGPKIRVFFCASLAGLALALGRAEVGHASVLTVGVGAGYDYATLSEAVAAAQANDTIDIAAGTYVNDFSTINVPLTIEGVGGTAVLDATVPIPNAKGILITNADLTVKNLEFEGASVTAANGANGAGVRDQAGNLVIENSIFSMNQDGILSNPDSTATITVSNSQFLDNGYGGDGYTHAIYAGAIASLTVSDSTFTGTQVGHDIKSRAAQTIVTGNTLDDGVTGTTSYAVDIPNGGLATITGNAITQGVNTQNETMISYGEEGVTYTNNSLLVSDNSFVNYLPSGSIGVYNHSDVFAQLANNTFDNVASPLVGPGEIVSTPEPASGVLLLSALALLPVLRRKGGG